MRILIIAVFGILSYLIVFFAGYFMFVSEEDSETVLNSTLKKFLENRSEDKSAEKLSLANQGDAPPPK